MELGKQEKDLLFDCPMVNFGPLLRGQPHSPNVNHYTLSNLQGHQELRKGVGFLSLAEHLVGFELGKF